MRVRLPFLHLWAYLVRAESTPWRCRECRICGRFEIYAYGYWNATERSSWEPLVPR